MFSSNYVAQKLQQRAEHQGLRHLVCDPFLEVSSQDVEHLLDLFATWQLGNSWAYDWIT